MIEDENLEEMIREGLIEQRVDELCEIAVINPEYKDALIVGKTAVVSSVYDSICDDERTKIDALQEYQTELEDDIDNLLKEPEVLKASMYHSIEILMSPAEQLKSELGPYTTHFLKFVGKKEILIKEYEKTFDVLFSYSKKNDEFIKRLAEVAKTEKNLDKALEKATINRITRELYPTANDYREHIKGGIKAREQFFEEAIKVLSKDEYFGHVMSPVVNGFNAEFKAISKLELPHLENEVKEIYG